MISRCAELETNEYVHVLFHLALLRHENSLTALFVNAPGVMGWCICPDFLLPLYTCQNPVKLGLSVSVKGADERDGVESLSVVCNPSKFLKLTVNCFTILSHRRIWSLPPRTSARFLFFKSPPWYQSAFGPIGRILVGDT